MHLTRFLNGGDGEKLTNILREGGVYLLPIARGSDEYYVVGDLIVLFEIDDKGLIYSHSHFEDFKQYDDKPYTVVTDEIKQMTEND